MTHSPSLNVLSLWSDNDLSALNATFRSVVSEERYHGEYELRLTPNTMPPISHDKVQCRIVGVRNPNERSTTTLPDALRYDTEQTLTTVVIDYEDAEQNQFSRLFTLAKNIDDSVTWIPSPIRLRGECEFPGTEAQDLDGLRAKLRLAARYDSEHQAAEQYLQRFTEAQKDIKRLTWRCQAYEQASVIWAFEGEVKRLRYRLLDLLQSAETLAQNGKRDLLELLAHPLSDDSPPLSNSLERPKKWRVIQDFRDLRHRLPDSVAMSSYMVPNPADSQEVIKLLVQTANQLATYAASLLGDTSAKATTS